MTVAIGLRDTLDLSLRLHPGTRNLAYVTGTSEFERYWLAMARREFRPYADRVRLVEIVGLRNDEILEQVARLPKATVVLFQLIPRESSRPAAGLDDLMTAIGQRFPTYCFFRNFCVDRGGVGGSYSDYADQTSRTSELAARLLSGEKAEDIRVVYDSAPHATVDSRQLRRWDIPESALPLGTVVLFRQPSNWERYQKYLPVESRSSSSRPCSSLDCCGSAPEGGPRGSPSES